MPSKTKTRNAAIAAKTAALPKLPKELFDQIAAGRHADDGQWR